MSDSIKKPLCKICDNGISLEMQNLHDDRYGYPGSFDVYVCKSCRFAQTEPQITDSQLSDLYTKYYPRQKQTATDAQKDASWQPGSWYAAKSYVMGTNNVAHHYCRPASTVLDVGCSNGWSLLELKRNKCKAYGTEADRNVESIASALSLNITIGDISDIKDKSIDFDYITASQLIEHIPDLDFFILSLKKRLKQDGSVILSMPNFGSLPKRIWGRQWINWHIPFHQNFFTKRSIKLLAVKHGLEITRLKTITPNVWTLIQFAGLVYPSAAGQGNYLWSPEKKISFSRKLIFNIVKIIFMTIITIPNRIIDILGFGDGMLVELKFAKKAPTRRSE
jgi:2-polyprenyl-3-methyl-5-hydroxy-6-metoxy-1,4-benzoquinol methylase